MKELTWGIKGVGAQGDGSVQLLARGREEQAELTRVLKETGEGRGGGAIDHSLRAGVYRYSRVRPLTNLRRGRGSTTFCLSTSFVPDVCAFGIGMSDVS